MRHPGPKLEGACQLPEVLVRRPQTEALPPRIREVVPEGLAAEKATEWMEEQA